MAPWLFGSRSQPQDFSQFVSPSAPGGGGGDDNDKKIGHKMEAYRFDSAALEEAPKAVKDLEKSAFAQQALELSKHQEEAKPKELELQIEHAKIESKEAETEERQEILQEQPKLDHQKSEHQLQLLSKRYEAQLLLQQRLYEENLRKLEESVARQEEIRNAAIEQELEIKLKYDLKLKEAEMKAKAEFDRKYQDLKLEQIKVKAEQDREDTQKSHKKTGETIISSINTASSAIGTISAGINKLMDDPMIEAAVCLTMYYFALKESRGPTISQRKGKKK